MLRPCAQRWRCVRAGSGVFLALNLKQPIQQSLVPSRQAMALLIVFVNHQALAVLLRPYVLRYDLD